MSEEKCMICGAPTPAGDYTCNGECAKKARNTIRLFNELTHYSTMLDALAAEALRSGNVVLHGAHTDASRVYSTLIGKTMMERIIGRLAEEGKAKPQ